MSEQQSKQQRTASLYVKSTTSNQTECERIIREGILPADFFKPEIICDFYVDENRKKIWAIEIDLLIQFDKICTKYGLRYFLAFGALLGAVRHHGFIPWDDDLDVCMPRADYEKFLAIADNELAYPYFLQVPGKDNDYFFSFAKLRNSQTSAISFPFRYARFNQGIFLDIFVLDNTLPTSAEQDYNQVKQLIFENSANMRRSSLNPSKTDLEKINAFAPRNPMAVLNEMQAIYISHESAQTEYQMVSGLAVYACKKLLFRKQDVTEIITTNMYGHDFCIPKHYDTVLSTTYGDYMQFPPIEERGKWHNTLVFDPDVPYTETIKRLIAEDSRSKSCKE
jgi:lipopolysaccharide cholinephosphotransferase